MQKKAFAILLLIITVNTGYSQHLELSSDAEISIITAGPGKILYENFGHSTIRIKDTNFDTAYNYGMFDFKAPNFFLNFTKGKLLYKLESYPFHYFVRSYQTDGRWIKEQVLNLNMKEKQQFYEYLETNAKPENATYLYDPFFNNCATILREITETILQEKVTFKTNHIQEKKSFRTLMNDEIPWNTWGSFGINLALGSKLDHIASEKEHMYLPDFVYSGFNNATVTVHGTEDALIKMDRYIIKFENLKLKPSRFNPLFIFSIILVIGLYITVKDIKRKKRTKWLDFLLFFSTGLIGLLIVFLWFFTDHSTTPRNFNILWAFAPNLFVAFSLLKEVPKKWVRNYLIGLMLLLCIIPIVWVGKVQQLPLASIPFIILLLIRYGSLQKYLLTSKE